ncbi:hypothetical protein LQ764DRAFT_234310 [Zygosaccharomyces rouxii]|nr:hypothetical protein LQ764DRAFT_234310 [Zygosaccharomyces rouxii]
MTTREIILIVWAYMTSHTPGNDQYFYDEFVAFALAPFISQGLKLKGEVQESKFPIWNL